MTQRVHEWLAALHAIRDVVREQDPVFTAGFGREERVEARHAGDPGIGQPQQARHHRKRARWHVAAVLLDFTQDLQEVVGVVIPARDAAPDARFVGLCGGGHDRVQGVCTPSNPDCVLRRRVCAGNGSNPMRDGTVAVVVVT